MVRGARGGHNALAQTQLALASAEQPQGDEHEADARSNPERAIFRQTELDQPRAGFDGPDDLRNSNATAIFAE